LDARTRILDFEGYFVSTTHSLLLNLPRPSSRPSFLSATATTAYPMGYSPACPVVTSSNPQDLRTSRTLSKDPSHRSWVVGDIYLVVQNGGEFIRREIRICRLPRSDWRRLVLKSNDEQGQCIMTCALEVRRLTQERSRCILSFSRWSGGRATCSSRMAEGSYTCCVYSGLESASYSRS